ncbi:MAG TPA: RsmB/NOP family class I SAM-dependent RNA methyltransferase [Candidatus Egerieenecus merdigallinarum]|nr:RsmB/NOP family class I SAM-dependent RNA methyltransferase [Candidatus Egerieenecus merdigallinarum]
MSAQLPQAFVERMAARLKDELPAFLRSYEEPYCRGIRFQPGKLVPPAAWPAGVGEQIPWEPAARYLAMESDAGTMVLHEAGGWYLQEPSAMAPVAALNPQPGERVLDLCAAPGGKSTQIAAHLGGKGLLVSNEPVPKRAAVLSRNLERMGVTNALAVSAYPDQLAAQWPAYFDAVLVDAPCSGEGMFRRHPETREEWSPEAPAGCAKRQREILAAAARLVRPGGRMVYSTCTLNTMENEENISWFLREHSDFSVCPFQLPGVDGTAGMATLFPHRVRGEGHFLALLVRQGEDVETCATSSGLPQADAVRMRALQAFACGEHPVRVHMLGETLVSLPEACPALRGIRVLRAGLHLGQVRGKLFFPDHAWALSVQPPECPRVALTQEEAMAYQAGEELPAEGTGYVLPTFEGLPLGWGKVSNGRMKNHYPKGLRRTLR